VPLPVDTRLPSAHTANLVAYRAEMFGLPMMVPTIARRSRSHDRGTASAPSKSTRRGSDRAAANLPSNEGQRPAMAAAARPRLADATTGVEAPRSAFLRSPTNRSPTGVRQRLPTPSADACNGSTSSSERSPRAAGRTRRWRWRRADLLAITWPRSTAVRVRSHHRR
jgi:hypothetical protein